MGKSKLFDRLAFILGMKKQAYPQAIGSLFMLGENGDLYACALGQGLLETSADEDAIRAELKPLSLGVYRAVERESGKVVEIKARRSPDFEISWTAFARDNLGTDFTNGVMRANDWLAEPVPSIAARLRTILGV